MTSRWVGDERLVDWLSDKVGDGWLAWLYDKVGDERLVAWLCDKVCDEEWDAVLCSKVDDRRLVTDERFHIASCGMTGN